MSKVLTDGNDLGPLLGTADFVVYALNGNDVVFSGLTQAHLFGGDGSDFLAAENNVMTDFARIYGGAGNDSGHGSQHDGDQLYGDDGDDLIVGGEFDYDAATGGSIVPFAGEPSGSDYIEGGSGRDGLYGFDGDDTIYGGDGDDSTVGTISTKSDASSVPADATNFFTLIKAGLYGGDGNDFLDGGRGDDSLFGGNDNDALYGGEGNDDLHGQFGDDVVAGGFGDDSVDGGPGNDTVLGGFGNDSLDGGPGDDRAFGGEGDDTLVGGDGNDLLRGGDGNDLLRGGLGNDTLRGEDGSDTFVFDVALGATNVDTILGFEHKVDKIELSQAIFSDLDANTHDIGTTLDKPEFFVGSKAHDKSDRIIYNANNGKLFFDHDGHGGDPKVLFAILDDHLHLKVHDFLMVA
jgi:serralysin